MTAKARIVASPDAAPSALYIAYAEWMKVRARLAALDVSGETGKQYEQAVVEALDASGDAEWKMIRAQSQCLSDIRLRASIVQDMFTTVEHQGEYNDRRHLAALNILINEVLSPFD